MKIAVNSKLDEERGNLGIKKNFKVFRNKGYLRKFGVVFIIYVGVKI